MIFVLFLLLLATARRRLVLAADKCWLSDGSLRTCYTVAMMDEQEFRGVAESALGALMQHLIVEEDKGAQFEAEQQAGVLNILFEEPPAKFVVTPNTPVRQIWISALATSFKLDWDKDAGAFVLARSGEQMIPLVDRLIGEHLAS